MYCCAVSFMDEIPEVGTEDCGQACRKFQGLYTAANTVALAGTVSKKSPGGRVRPPGSPEESEFSGRGEKRYQCDARRSAFPNSREKSWLPNRNRGLRGTPVYSPRRRYEKALVHTRVLGLKTMLRNRLLTGGHTQKIYILVS